MSVTYTDYYKSLGVPRTADEAAIKKAYRHLARKFHPDVNKTPDAEARFKQVTEAYEVLGDREKRKRYDELGMNWQAGDSFSPPPGWPQGRFDRRAGGEETFDGFSDFFETLFGAGARGHRSGGRPMEPQQGADQEAEVSISLEEAYHGTTRKFTFTTQEPDGSGRLKARTRTYSVRIPKGTVDGSRIRLGGQGGDSAAGGQTGDLFLHIRTLPHPVFRVNGNDVEFDLSVAPWEAALGSVVSVSTLDGDASLRIPAGTQGGQRLRLRGRGLPCPGGGERGDLYAKVRMVVPHPLSSTERELFERLSAQSVFRPRG